jgi:N-formylglutamate deformylase
MSEPFTFHQGTAPLLISMPHAGTALTDEVRNNLAETARSLPDTDWHLPRLYAFAKSKGASIIAAHYSRFVIDLNRPPDDTPLYATATTGLYPETLFDGTPLYTKPPSAEARARWLENIWQPYHARIEHELARLVSLHGRAVILDAHSIRGIVPRLFDGELPDFNIGTNDGKSCGPALATAVTQACHHPRYTHVLNGRFKGGYITRHYGRPNAQIQAVQLELAQRTYMDEAEPFEYRETLALDVQPSLQRVVDALIH